MYTFGNKKADGNSSMRNLLGGKGANLAEMTRLGIPVPPGFTISTDVCLYYMEKGSYPDDLDDQVQHSLSQVENIMGQKFGATENPLLVSIRSGARQSMPGMMETVLNIGLTEQTIPGLIEKTGDKRFVYDAYRRLITMYSDVVMEKSQGLSPKNEKGIREQLEVILDNYKSTNNYRQDADLTTDDLKIIIDLFG